jgi:hypothetical protein
MELNMLKTIKKMILKNRIFFSANLGSAFARTSFQRLILSLAVLGGETGGFGQNSASQVRSINYDFCTIDEVIPHGVAREASEVWGRATIQQELRALIIDPVIADTPWNAYPISYLTMTDARDQERCHGNLASRDRANRLIGDLLADYMTRGLIAASRTCPTLSPGISTGLCGAMGRIKNRRMGALEAALDVTSVYLSSHMAEALVAVILDDSFWNQEFPANTHCRSTPSENGQRLCPRSILQARLAWIQRYKIHYDKNNQFLSQNLVTVIRSLQNACYLGTPLPNVGAGLISQVPGISLIFGQIRDRTFRAALAWAATNPIRHPMLQWNPQEGIFVPRKGEYHPFTIMPAPLRDAEDNGRSVLLGAQWLTRLLGPLASRSWSELGEFRPSGHPGCGVSYRP